MTEYTTYAIVLKKETINEADGKIILYTELQGKMEIVAKGLKKILAKFNSHLEPLNLIETTFIAANNKHLTSVLTINNFSIIRRNSLTLKDSLKMLNFFNDVVIASEKDEFLWKSLLNYLNSLNLINKIGEENQELFVELIDVNFLINLAKGLGVMPDINDLADYFNQPTIEIIKLLSQLRISEIIKTKELSNLKKFDYNMIKGDLKRKMIIN